MPTKSTKRTELIKGIADIFSTQTPQRFDQNHGNLLRKTGSSNVLAKDVCIGQVHHGYHGTITTKTTRIFKRYGWSTGETTKERNLDKENRNSRYDWPLPKHSMDGWNMGSQEILLGIHHLGNGLRQIKKPKTTIERGYLLWNTRTDTIQFRYIDDLLIITEGIRNENLNEFFVKISNRHIRYTVEKPSREQLFLDLMIEVDPETNNFERKAYLKKTASGFFLTPEIESPQAYYQKYHPFPIPKTQLECIDFGKILWGSGKTPRGIETTHLPDKMDNQGHRRSGGIRRKKRKPRNWQKDARTL